MQNRILSYVGTLLFLAVNGQVDAAVGPAATPSETRQRLQEAIDAASRNGEVVLSGGVYEIDGPLRLSGAVTLRAADGAKVTISGGRRLSLEWQSSKGNALQAKLPADLDLDLHACDQLYLNRKLLHPARFPNYDRSQRFFGGTSAEALSKHRIRSWGNPAGGFVHSLHRSEWGGNHWRIKGKRADGTLDLEGGWMNNRPSGINPTHRFVENIYEELDAPGEWFLDRESRTIYLIPPAEVDLAKATLFVSGIERLIEITGVSPAIPSERVCIRDIQFVGTSRTFMKSNEPLLRSDWMIHRGGAVFIENARDVSIEDCNFHNLGGNGIFVSGYAENVVVRGCHLSDLGASGVCFVGKPEAVRSPSFNYHQAVPLAELDWEPGPKTEDYPRDCAVEDCLIHSIGTIEKQTAGIQISMASRITVRHVSVYDTPRAGINISEGTWGGHLIEWCDVFDTVLMTGDHGAFNSWGRDRFWHPNRSTLDQLTSQHPELVLLDAVEATVIRNSRWRCDHGWDIDLDDGSSNYHVYKNLCLNGGIKLREGFHRHVYNNVIINNSIHPHVWFNDSHDKLERNIMMTWYRPIRVPSWGDEVDHNLLPDLAALDRSHQLGLDRNSITGDPGFLDPGAGDFRVSDGSPALTIGFKNFRMDQFGVLKPSLRKIARTPKLPSLRIRASSQDANPGVFLGATVKRLQGRGERSATGMDSERGVLVLTVPSESVAESAGIQENDVILRVGGIVTNQPNQLQPAYLKTDSIGMCDFVVFRDQREQTIEVPGVLAVRLNVADANFVGNGNHPFYDQEQDLVENWSDESVAMTWNLECRGPVTMDVYLIVKPTVAPMPTRWLFEMAGETVEVNMSDAATSGGRERIHLGQFSFERYGKVTAKLQPSAPMGVKRVNLRAVDLVRRGTEPE